jgi:hypothetical protein
VEEALAKPGIRLVRARLFRGEEGAAMYAAMMGRLESRREALSALPSSPEIVE